MLRIKLSTAWCVILLSILTEADVSNINSEKRSMDNLKEVFTKSVLDVILKFSPYLKKFDFAYLGSANSMYYAREIAKAIANAPLFNKKEGIEEYVMEGISQLTLPCSETYCEDVWCTISGIADVTANVSIQGKFVTPDITERAIIKKANNLAGNVLWRLSRIPNPDNSVLLVQENLSLKTSNRMFSFTKLLSTAIYNSQYVSNYFKNSVLNVDNSLTLSSPVCGSSYFDFHVELVTDMSSRMSDMYTKTKTTYTPNANSTLDSMVKSSIIAETVALNLLKKGFFEGNESLEEAANDIMKLMMVGITSSRMKIHAGNVAREIM